jgi:hypothetical protein
MNFSLTNDYIWNNLIIWQTIISVNIINDTNRSKEHKFLNSIGGMYKPSEFCLKCNSKLGYGPDGELARQLEFLSAYLQIKRDKGSIPIIKGGHTQDGTKLHQMAEPMLTAVIIHYFFYRIKVASYVCDKLKSRYGNLNKENDRRRDFEKLWFSI